MALRTIVRHFLALLMLFAVCTPYVHAAAEFGQHEQCSMEMCKRAGKCCCRQANAGKPHLDTRDVCHSGGAQLATASFLVAELLGGTRTFHGLALVADSALPHALCEPGEPLAIVRFQRPPPLSL